MSKTSQHRNILLAIGGFISVIVIVGTIGYFTVDREPTTIQGSLEVSEYRVSCKLPGRIKEIRVQEGEIVHKGDTLAILEIPEINAQEDVAKATAGATEALSDLVEAPTRKETVEAAYQLYQQAVAAMGIAEKTFGRTDRLYAEGVVTAIKEGTATITARAQQKEAAIEQAKAARSAVNVVKSVLKETIQVATHDGEVSTIYPKVGELVGLGSPIMSISIMDDMWGTFNVREDELKGLKIGDTFTAFVPAFNKDIKMKVYAMKDAGSYATWKATKTTGQYDLKTFQVKARPINKFEGLRPGMSLIVKK